MTATLLTRDDILTLRAQAEVGHWDNAAGVRLLREVEQVIQPVLCSVARRHRVPIEDLTSTTLRACWLALRRYDPVKSPDPWGWVAATARRAAGDAAVIASTGHAVRGRARLAAGVAATRRRLAAELGRAPAGGEVIAALPRGLQTSAAKIAADGDLAAFIGVGAPLLTYDETILDRPAPSGCASRATRCRWFAELAARLGLELGLPGRYVEVVLELAADLAGDLIPAVGVAAAAPRIADELSQAAIAAQLSDAAARRCVEALLSAADASVRPQDVAA